MNVQTITMAKEDARKAFQAYRSAIKDRHDAEAVAIMRGYKALAKGRALVDLFEVLKEGGCDHLGQPRLAVARAHWQQCHFRGSDSGGGSFVKERHYWWSRSSQFSEIIVPGQTFPAKPKGDLLAVVPLIPAPLRPAFSLTNYHLLWEADWTSIPRDPMLLRHLSGSLYAVLATWDLTPLEQAVLRGRSV